MRTIWRRRPSPAMVVACVSLAIALGGTSYAAVMLVPRNSVGTIHLRNNAVVSAKVRNGSLLSADFRAGQIPAGPVGPAGPTGPAGPAGPSDAYARVVGGPVVVTGAFTTYANLPIPQAGRYVVWAKTGVLSSDATTRQLTCTLVVANLQVEQATGPVSSAIRGGLAMVAPLEFANPGSVDFRCAGGGPTTNTPMSVLDIRVVAVRVGTLNVTQ